MTLVETRLTLALFALKERVDNFIVECNAWFLVLLAVLMTLAFTIYAGLTIWCVVYKGKKFTGKWTWNQNGVSVKAECR